MNKVVKITLVSVIIFTAFIALVVFQLRGQSISTHDDILRLTPIGTSMETVINRIRNTNELGIHHIDNEFGFALSGNPSWLFTDEDEIIGVKSIRGYFRIIIRDRPFNRSRSSYEHILWGFDEDGKLIDVFIWHPSE